MKRLTLAIALAVLLSSCSPTTDFGAVASRAANRAVATAVDAAVSSVIRRSVNLIVDRVFNLVIASTIDNMFSPGEKLEPDYGSNFDLDVGAGSYKLKLSGNSALTGEFSFSGGEPPEGATDYDSAVGLRGKDEAGNSFLSASLSRKSRSAEPGFTIILLETRPNGVSNWQVEIQFVNSGAKYRGKANVHIDSLSEKRFVGSFSAASLKADGASGNISIEASFDISINPTNSLTLRTTN